MCFIYNDDRESENNAYNYVALARCCKEGAGHKLLERMNVFLQDMAINFYEAVVRHYMKIGDESHDFFYSLYILS